MRGRKSKRVLVYSHDSFGLGHLRRCREIAHSLVGSDSDISVLILSGSPIIGSFDFRARVDFVRIPGVIKLRNGEYTSLKLHIDTEHTLAIRSSIVERTAQVFDPHLFLVDKEPLGLCGEVRDTLAMMKARGTACVLGLRDVMDDPVLLETEWRRKNVLPTLEAFYDDIWVYGLPQICDPLAGIPLSTSLRKRMTYTGYLGRHVSEAAPVFVPEKIDDPFLLVTVGGGGDGEAIVDWVLSAYEADPDLPYPALLVLGPFMSSQHQGRFFASDQPPSQRRGNHLRRPHREFDGARQSGGLHGRLQHFLRSAVVRQTCVGDPTHLAAQGAVHSCHPGPRSGACAHAGRRRSAGSAHHGDRAAQPASTGAAL